jgi:hypothetical protein
MVSAPKFFWRVGVSDSEIGSGARGEISRRNGTKFARDGSSSSRSQHPGVCCRIWAIFVPFRPAGSPHSTNFFIFELSVLHLIKKFFKYLTIYNPTCYNIRKGGDSMKKKYSLDFSIVRDIDRLAAVRSILDSLATDPSPTELE